MNIIKYFRYEDPYPTFIGLGEDGKIYKQLIDIQHEPYPYDYFWSEWFDCETTMSLKLMIEIVHQFEKLLPFI